MGIILESKGVNKFFHDPQTFQVLKDVSFSINQGEFVSVVGKSGCGKSTLLYILSTMDTEYEGSLSLNNQELTGLDAQELAKIRNKEIGFVFQFHYLLPEFTVIENVMLPAQKLGVLSDAEIKNKAMEKLELLNIAHLAEKKSQMISGGEKQRVAIARALINDPLIIMGDEPTGNLDSKNAENVFNVFKDLSRDKKMALLIVTHDQDFANRTDRIITMDDGRIV